MYGPESGRKCTQLNAFHAAAFDERDRVLKVVMSILRAVGREDAPGRHRFAVDCFDNAHFVGADLDERHLAHNLFKRVLGEMQTGLQYVRLNTDFAFGGNHSSRRHLCAKVSSFFDRDFARADVNEDALQDYEEDDQKYEGSEEHG